MTTKCFTKAMLHITLAICLVLAMAACGGGSQSGDSGNANATAATNTNTVHDDTVEWKFAANLMPDSTWAIRLQQMFDEVYEKTDGRLLIEPFWQGALGAEADVLQNVQTGNVAGLQFSIALLAQYDPAMTVFDVPGLYGSSEEFDNYVKSDAGQELLGRLEDHGLWMPSCGLTGYRMFNTTKTLIQGLDDISGMTIRTMDSISQMAAVESFGGIAITVPYSDVYNALNTGVCDGWVGVPQGVHEISAYEVAPYITNVPIFPCGSGMIFSMKAINELPEEDAEVFKSVYLETMPEIFEIAWQANLDYLDEMLEKGMLEEYFDITDAGDWMTLASQTWDELKADNQGLAEQIDAVLAANGRA